MTKENNQKIISLIFGGVEAGVPVSHIVDVEDHKNGDFTVLFNDDSFARNVFGGDSVYVENPDDEVAHTLCSFNFGMCS